jgi:DNA-binding response OmpR family regulator
MKTRVLIIDDDPQLGSMLVEYLQDNGLKPAHRLDGAEGLEALHADTFDIVILDVMLPDTDGFEVLRRIRTHSEIPTLMLTAKGEPTDRIVGLELGADDYMPKPFAPRELLARIRAILRRGQTTQAQSLRFGRLLIDVSKREVRLDEEIKELTGHQFDLLHLLATRAGRVQSRDQLMQGLRGHDLETFDRSIDVHISRIRAAIETDPKNPSWIRSIRGVGYIFTAQDEEA